MKAVILARVSSANQEDGQSLADQKDNLKEYCIRKKLEVIRIFEFVESSTRGDRKKFHEMLDFVKAQNETIAIVAYAVDRVQRSFKESTGLDELIRKDKIELHFIRENMRLTKDAKTPEIMLWDYSVLGAKTHILNLRDHADNTIKNKLRRGEWIGVAPIGYLNAKDPLTGKSTVILDKDRAYLVRKAFEDYSTGNYSLGDITRYLQSQGFGRHRSNKLYHKSQVSVMLANPFYYGYMRVQGSLYKHHYETIIDEFLFEKCQKVREGYHRKPFKYSYKPFIFRGLIRCAHCGCAISSDLKKGKYIYLFCSKYKGNCPAIRVREEVLLDQIQKTFKKMSITKEAIAAITKDIQKGIADKKRFQKDAIASIRNEYETIQKKLDRLLDLRLEEPPRGITQDEYDRKARELKQRQYELDRNISAHTEADEDFAVTVNTLLNLVSSAHELFMGSKADQKRQLINFTLSNLRLDGQKLLFTMKKPFDLFQKPVNRLNWRPISNAFRTSHYHFLIEFKDKLQSASLPLQANIV